MEYWALFLILILLINILDNNERLNKIANKE